MKFWDIQTLRRTAPAVLHEEWAALWEATAWKETGDSWVVSPLTYLECLAQHSLLHLIYMRCYNLHSLQSLRTNYRPRYGLGAVCHQSLRSVVLNLPTDKQGPDLEAIREWTIGKGGRRRPILKNEGKRWQLKPEAVTEIVTPNYRYINPFLWFFCIVCKGDK